MYGFFLFCFIVGVSRLQISSKIAIENFESFDVAMSMCNKPESVNLTCQSARTVRLFCSNQFCPSVLAIILLVTSDVATLSFTQHQRLRALIFLMFPPQKNIIFFMEHIFVDLPFPNLVPRVLSLLRESTLVAAGHVSMHANRSRTEGGSST